MTEDEAVCAQAREEFVTLYTAGDAWLAERPLHEQPHFAQQIAYWDEQLSTGRFRGLMRVTGTRKPTFMVGWSCADLDEARELARSSPLVAAQVLKSRTRPGSLASR